MVAGAPGTLPGPKHSSKIRHPDSQAEDLPLIVSSACGASPHIALNSVAVAININTKMSVTLTENRVTYSLGRTLADYDLQHSGEDSDVSAAPNSRSAPEGTSNNPSDWEDNFRRVPDYRPVDTSLDFSYRDTTQNGIERAFIWNMFNGIVLTSATNRLWRATGGKINNTYFRWQVGGEH
ncbi:hypothetical protein E4T42_05337 [Aureobasidium subglaciale]|nr:hypothetical protein E4T42_05337 [Aureobasidium subglaciale]